MVGRRNRRAWNVDDALSSKAWCARQLALRQALDGSHRSAEPVSTQVVKLCSGVPTPSSP